MRIYSKEIKFSSFTIDKIHLGLYKSLFFLKKKLRYAHFDVHVVLFVWYCAENCFSDNVLVIDV